MRGATILKATLLTVVLAIAAVALVYQQYVRLFVLVLVSNVVESHQPPAIADGQITDDDWLKWDQGSRKFSAALARRFPAGTSEGTVRATLYRQGFRDASPPLPDCIPFNAPKPVGRTYSDCPRDDSWKRTMEYEWGGLPCVQTLDVKWFIDEDRKITRIEGRYGGGCL